MAEKKMTNMIISTGKFLVTLAYPVKSRTQIPGKKKGETQTKETVDAIIEVTPIVHSPKDKASLVSGLYAVLCHEAKSANTKNKRSELVKFLEECDETLRKEIDESLTRTHIEKLSGQVEHIFVNLVDKAGDLIHSDSRSLQDLLMTFEQIETALHLWKAPKKRSAFLVPATPKKTPKPRQKEKVKTHYEGGMCRYRSTTPKSRGK